MALRERALPQRTAGSATPCYARSQRGRAALFPLGSALPFVRGGV
jgi:hypothetical protein